MDMERKTPVDRYGRVRDRFRAIRAELEAQGIVSAVGVMMVRFAVVLAFFR